MTEEEKNDNSLNFVVRYYRKDAFRPRRLGKILHFEPRHRFFSRRNIAAACVTTALIACAGIGTYLYVQPDASKETPAVEVPVSTTQEIHRLKFDNAPLSEVIKEIESVYSVKLTSLPQEEYRLTLSYEGTAEDLIATINELLGTKIEIAQ